MRPPEAAAAAAKGPSINAHSVAATGRPLIGNGANGAPGPEPTAARAVRLPATAAPAVWRLGVGAGGNGGGRRAFGSGGAGGHGNAFGAARSAGPAGPAGTPCCSAPRAAGLAGPH
ncbi:hypothetical protein [Mycobacterium tuberculosis]|uniref:hypothetical protein n=1 Tax=Mycobacterium tuberculosis TaxID=1773 RepID=UPI003D7C2CF2